MPQHLHIVCFTVPYPVDYGAIYDLFYKLPALQRAGIAIHLHCFTYNRSPQKELERYCVSVDYYPRKTGIKGVSPRLPYIVSSRKNKALLNNLLQDDYPILMEGIHCTYPLLDKRFRHRKLFVRLHNVEYRYYYHLYKSAAAGFKKMYYLAESILLKKQERRVARKATAVWTVSSKDATVYKEEFGCKKVSYLPLFLPPWQVAGKLGNGSYCIYHGNLSVAENEQAALWLIREVFAGLNVPLVIAGKNPSAQLLKAADAGGIRVAANVPVIEMQILIADAQVQVLPSFNATGIKLKLLNALYNGRHCITNTAAVDGTGLAVLCHIGDTPAAMRQLIKSLWQQPFGSADIDKRKEVLYGQFDNAAAAQFILKAMQEP